MRLSAIGLLVLTAAASEPNWPQFRGPSADGLGEGSPPTEWNVDSGKNIRWRTEIPGLGHSSPVVWGDRIFVTSAVPASGESSLKVGMGYFCFDSGVLSVYKMATGERLYQQPIGGGTSAFSSFPVAAGGHLYITNEEGHSYVLVLGSEYKPVAENDLGDNLFAIGEKQ
jgi:outer membrane protein assembly factor BamB